MSPGALAGGVVAAAGCAVIVASTLAMLLLPQALDRLHLLAPVGSFGAPLVAVGVVIAQVAGHGWSLGSGEVLLIAVVLAVTGPPVSAATARMRDERARARNEEPE